MHPPSEWGLYICSGHLVNMLRYSPEISLYNSLYKPGGALTIVVNLEILFTEDLEVGGEDGPFRLHADVTTLSDVTRFTPQGIPS